MAFVAPKETYPGKVYEVAIGTEKTAVFGGENVLPFHAFEGSAPNRPVIAFEVQDIPPDDWPETVRKVYEGVSGDPVTWAKFCQDKLNAKAIALRLVSTHPDRGDRSAADAANTVKDVLAAVNVPLIVLGSNHAEKDSSVLVAVAEAAKGKNCIIGKAQEAKISRPFKGRSAQSTINTFAQENVFLRGNLPCICHELAIVSLTHIRKTRS